MERRDMLALMLGAAAAPMAAQSATAQTNDPGAVVRAFAETLGAHDLTAFAALFSDDYVNHQTSAAAPPMASGMSAKQGTVGFFGGRLKGLPDLSVSIEAMLTAGDMSAASFVYEGTHRDVYLGVAPTGKKLHFTSCDIFRVRGGKIVEHWGMGDIAGVMAQLRG